MTFVTVFVHLRENCSKIHTLHDKMARTNDEKNTVSLASFIAR